MNSVLGLGAAAVDGGERLALPIGILLAVTTGLSTLTSP
jgi:hypothetical protein